LGKGGKKKRGGDLPCVFVNNREGKRRREREKKWQSLLVLVFSVVSFACSKKSNGGEGGGEKKKGKKTKSAFPSDSIQAHERLEKGGEKGGKKKKKKKGHWGRRLIVGILSRNPGTRARRKKKEERRGGEGTTPFKRRAGWPERGKRKNKGRGTNVF